MNDETGRATATPPTLRRVPWWFRAMLPWFRREWPIWGRCYHWCGGYRQGLWRGAGAASVVGKLHGYTMRLDLANWSERLSWALGRYHDLPIQLALQRVLRAGDCFVDIGANIGMLAILAHRLVGDSGRVIACEPNPRLRARLEAVVAENRLGHFELVAKALGERAGEAELQEFGGHSGWGSLAGLGPSGLPATATWRVPVVRGDEILADVDPNMPLVLKIDVEGFEVPVLRGLDRILARQPIVFVEIVEEHQRRAGHSAAELRALLEARGYRGFALRVHRRRLFTWELAPEPLPTEASGEIDAVFVPAAGPLAGRLREA